MAEPVGGWLPYCWDAKSADEALRSHWAVQELQVSKDPSTGPSTVSSAPLPLADPPRPSDSANLRIINIELAYVRQ